MDKSIDGFLMVFEGVRWLLQKIGAAYQRIEFKWQVIIVLAWMVLIGASVVSYQVFPGLFSPFINVTLVVAIGIAANYALHSC